MLNVVMLSVIMLGVVAPFLGAIITTLYFILNYEWVQLAKVFLPIELSVK
jgi:hypothetical protein